MIKLNHLFKIIETKFGKIINPAKLLKIFKSKLLLIVIHNNHRNLIPFTKLLKLSYFFNIFLSSTFRKAIDLSYEPLTNKS